LIIIVKSISIIRKTILILTISFLFLSKSYSQTDNEKVTSSFSWISSWIIKYINSEGGITFPAKISSNECNEMQKSYNDFKSINENNLNNDRRKVFKQLNNKNEIGFHIVEIALKNSC
jgi:hypothetical protein